MITQWTAALPYASLCHLNVRQAKSPTTIARGELCNDGALAVKALDDFPNAAMPVVVAVLYGKGADNRRNRVGGD